MSTAIEKLSEDYAGKLAAEFRKQALECVADLVDELAPEVVWNPDAEDEAHYQAWELALAEFTDHLERTLLLDPEPWVGHDGRRWPEASMMGEDFKPRLYFSRNREDYP